MAINWFTFFAQIVNFLIILFLLRRFLYGPIVSVMAEREAQIAARFKEAEEQAEEARVEAASYRNLREQMQDQREALLQEVTEEAESRRSALIDEARAEVQEMQQSWYTAVEHEKQRFLQEIRARMGGAVYHVARDALADLADADLEQAIVAEFLRKVEEQPLEEIDPPARQEKKETVVVRTTFEVSPAVQERIRTVLSTSNASGSQAADREGSVDIEFEQADDLVCGIEAQFNSRSISWNIRDYLDSYAEELSATLTGEIDARRARNEDVASAEELAGISAG